MSTEVAESTGYGPDLEMSLFGYAIGALIALLLLPLVPFAVVGWLIWRALGGGEGDIVPRTWKRRGRHSETHRTDRPYP